MNLHDKKILIVGFGKSGRAVLRYCLSKGAKVSVNDARKEETFNVQRATYSGHSVDWHLGSHPTEIFLSAI